MFQQYDILNETYQIVGEIGKGNIGVVFLAYHLRLEKYVVIKRIKDGSIGKLDLRKEVDILKNLHHPNLPQVYDFVQTRDSVYTVMDYVEGVDLSEYINSNIAYSEQQLVFWMRQLAEVLDYLHSQPCPIYHCDIKPGNIIINENGDAVLIDFNVSMYSREEQISGISALYASPEQLEIARSLLSGYYMPISIDCRSDIYSFGATFYHLAFGELALPEIVVGASRIPASPYSQGFIDVVLKMIEKSPEKRFQTAGELLLAIEKLTERKKRKAFLFKCRCISIVICALLIGLGAYFIINGVYKAKEEAYNDKQYLIALSITEGNDDKTEKLCFELLNGSEYQTFLKGNPADKAELLYVLAEIDYGKRLYHSSAEYCARALELAGDTAPSKYYRDAAIAYAESGDIASAQMILNDAREAGINDDDLSLARITLLSRSGKEKECLEEAERLIGSCNDREICARACIAAASACFNPASELSWLKKAKEYSDSRTILRGIAYSYIKISQTPETEKQAKEAASMAADCYKKLAQSLYATKTDRLNLAIAQMMAGQVKEAVEVLKKLYNEYPNDYNVLLNITFAYDLVGDSTNTINYCRETIAVYERKDTGMSSDKDSLQRLSDIANKYGIRWYP